MTATPAPTTYTLEALLAVHGAAIGSFGYLVLQHQTDAERILASTLATALGRANLPPDPEAARAHLLAIATREILRGSTQTGEIAPLLADPRSSVDRMPILEALAELDPRSRMAIVLHYFLDLPPGAVATVLDDDGFALRSDLNNARNRLQSRVEESLAAHSSPGEPFDARLRRALVEESTRFQPLLDAQELRMPAPRDDRVRRAAQRWWPLAVIAVLAAGVAAFLWLIPESGPTAGRQAAATQSVGSSSGTPAGPITLADCQITPAASPLAFAGWTTLAALSVHGGDAGPGQPIYAVVTRGMAEWVGWQEHYTGPMFPPPIGRMGCIFDPSTRKTSLVGVDLDWEPSLMADGCPPSPIDEFGGHREFGGPHAWLLLPDDISAWQVGENKILFRLSSPAAPGQSITAWTQPLADAGAIPAQVDSNTGELGPPDTSGSGSRYYFVTALFSSAGCWVINIAINGQVVGSAIAPITAAPLQALPRRQGSR